MSFEKRHRLVGPLTVGLMLLLALAGCGRKGDPQPPPRKNPERISDLEVRQSGHELILTMSYPTMTTGGLALPGISKLEVVQYTRPAPEFMEQPKGDLVDNEGSEGEGAPAQPEIEVVEPDVADAAVEVDDLTSAATPESEQVEEDSAQPASEGADVEGDPLEDEQAEVEEAPVEFEQPNPFLKIRIDAKEFDKQAETAVVLEGDELDAAVVGGRIEIRLPLEEIVADPPVAYAFAVETNAGRLRSPPSRTVAFVPLPPPPTPTDLTVTASWRGINLSWTEVEIEMPVPVESEDQAEAQEVLNADEVREAAEGEVAEPDEIEPPFEGYRVLRRLAGSAGYDEAIAVTEPGVTEYLDEGVPYGRTYVYTVTTMLMERPLVESAPADEREIEHRDIYPPDTPVGLVALAEAGRVRLLWETGRARDIAGYLIFVSVNGGARQQLNEAPLAATEFIHQSTISGTTYTYVVRAVDRTGNISEPSEAVSTRAP